MIINKGKINYCYLIFLHICGGLALQSNRTRILRGSWRISFFAEFWPLQCFHYLWKGVIRSPQSAKKRRKRFCSLSSLALKLPLPGVLYCSGIPSISLFGSNGHLAKLCSFSLPVWIALIVLSQSQSGT